MSLTDALLRPLLSTSSARPLITHYDDRTGSRVELSVATTANWAAKAANWLVEEHDVEPGDPVAVLLPAHWQTVGVLLGAWWCGAHVTDSPDGASVAFVTSDGSAPGARAVASVSLDPMGRDLGGSTEGLLDYVGEARMHGDDFLGLTPVPGDTPALAGSTVDEVMTLAAEHAAKHGITKGSRVLSTVDWSVPDGVLATLLAVLSVGGSLVQVSHPDPGRLAARRTAERTTVDLFDLSV